MRFQCAGLSSRGIRGVLQRLGERRRGFEPVGRKLLQSGDNGGLDMRRNGVPLKRIGEPADMAGAAIYLASKAGAYVSGVVIAVDGGIIACAGTL